MDNSHNKSVTSIAKQVKKYSKLKIPFYIYHGSTNSTRVLSFKRDGIIDVSDLNKVLSVNQAKQTAVVEPNVPMDKLIKETLKYDLIPPVVMEFPGITVGGGIQGGAGESSSFRYGCFSQTCNSYEMISANGDIINTSAHENADLFYGTAGSLGTLGIIVSAELQLVHAKKYVELTYLPVTSFKEAVKLLKQVTTQNYDYIDGIMFGSTHGVIIVGSLSDKIVGKLRRFKRARDPWFYLNAKAIDKQGKKITETVPLIDYLFRYDRGAFWLGHYAFNIVNAPFNKLTRWISDPIFHTRKLYQALQESGISNQLIIQDLALPDTNAVKFMEFVDQKLGVYPLWLCPLKVNTKSPLQSNNLHAQLVINVGVWGNLIKSRQKFIEANRLIEHKLSELKGKKWFYAHSYYTKEEFWNEYDERWYKALRSKYNATNLPDIYEKIRTKESHDVNIWRGAYKTIFRRTKLRIKD